MKKDKRSSSLKYDQQKELLTQFLRSFEDSSIQNQQECYKKYGNKKYMVQIQKIANLQSKVLEILIEDLQIYFTKDIEAQMVHGFRFNTFRYIKMFQQIVSEIMPQKTKQLNPEEELQAKYSTFLKKQRIQNFNSDPSQLRAENQTIPFRIHQNFDICIVYGPNSKVPIKTIGQIKSSNIGQLITTKAIIIRASEVRPELIVATYACDLCNCENYMEISDANFKPMEECKSKKCKEAMMTGKLTFLPSHSKFRSFQELKMQETPEQLQRGSIPKSIHLQLRGNHINNAQPGDIIKVQGIVLPRQLSKNKLHKDLFFDSFIYVTKIAREKKKYIDLDISQEMRDKVLSVRQSIGDDQKIIQNLAKSIAPQIYGLESVKKALLFQMAGGVTTQTQDHLRIRGEINIALFGDPGIAKSQLLKHISYISPRAVYTTGKGSSGVGLTAAIVTDPATKQLSLEAGALVLADMGICCIDEFDKMDEYDRTAIHQVMEQQTVSITKAGIITTLNARTAVLAAANPVYGRYNKSETTQKNLNLPAALLSRFDLIFILLDTADKQKDYELALHIGKVHQQKKVPVNGIFDQQFLKTYIAMAKEFNPVIPEDINQEMIRKYIERRQIQMDASKEGQSYTTMRSLLALIRLCQARAKLRFSNQVSNIDVMECIEIVQTSQLMTEVKTIIKRKVDNQTKIYEMIKAVCEYSPDKKANITKLQLRAINKGFSLPEIQKAIALYTNLGVLKITQEYIMLIS